MTRDVQSGTSRVEDVEAGRRQSSGPMIRIERASTAMSVEDTQQQSKPAPQIVLSIHADGSMDINTQPVTKPELPARLHEIFDVRPDKLIFIKADNSRRYQEVIEVMDVGRGAGVKVFGLVPGDATVAMAPTP